MLSLGVPTLKKQNNLSIKTQIFKELQIFKKVQKRPFVRQKCNLKKKLKVNLISGHGVQPWWLGSLDHQFSIQ